MEGNQMKMLNALKGIADICDGKVECKSTSEERLLIYNLAKSALTAPQRNCDVGTAEEQHRRFIDYCNTCDCPMGCIHRKEFIGMLDTRCASMLKCYIRWAQMPYESEEGGAK